jgi:hypothetical protein
MTKAIPALMIPATNLLNRMNFSKKFMLIGTIISAPLLFLTGVLYLEQAETVNRSEHEQVGLEYLAAVRPMIENVAKTRGLTAMFLKGETETQSQIMSLRKQVDQSFKQLAALDNSPAADTDSHSTSQLQDEWNNTNASAFDGPPAIVFEKYTLIVKKLIALMERTSQQTGLYSNASNFYVVDSLAVRLPDLAESLGHMRAQGASILAAGRASNRQRALLDVAAQRVADNLHHLKTNFQEIFAANDGFSDQSSSIVKSMDEAVSEYLIIARSGIADADQLYLDAGTYFEDGTAAIDIVFQLYDRLTPELVAQIEARISHAEHQKLALILLAALVIGTIAYLFSGFYFSTRNSLDQLGDAIGRFADGDLTVQPSSSSSDELGYGTGSRT